MTAKLESRKQKVETVERGVPARDSEASALRSPPSALPASSRRPFTAAELQVTDAGLVAAHGCADEEEDRERWDGLS